MTTTTTCADVVEARYRELWLVLRASGRLVPPRPGRLSKSTQLVVRVTDGALFRRLDRIRHALAAVRNVTTVPDHYLHLPVLELGRVTPTRRLARQAQEVLADLPPLVVELAKVGADDRGPFAELHPPDGLLALRERLVQLAPGTPPDEPFLPRLPLGRLVGPVDGGALALAVEWFRDRPIGAVRVEKVTLAVVRRRPMHWIEPVAELPLGRPAPVGVRP